jgi:hypothetical protein
VFAQLVRYRDRKLSVFVRFRAPLHSLIIQLIFDNPKAGFGLPFWSFLAIEYSFITPGAHQPQ